MIAHHKYTESLLYMGVLLALLSSCAGPAVDRTPLPTGTVAQITALPSPSPSPTPAPDSPKPDSHEMAPWPTEEWSISTPEEQGMDPQTLQAMFAAVRDGQVGLNSILIVRNGAIVAESYYAPFQQDDAQHLFSATKSVIATLVGIAIEDGYIRSVDQPLLDFFSAEELAPLDEQKRRMTIAHFLTMTSGLEWYEMAPYEGDSLSQMIASPSWVAFVLNQPLAHSPGETFCYSSGGSHVLSALLQQVTGMSTQAYAQERLFEPLGIHDVAWRVDPQDITIGGWGLSLTTRDMAKLGYLYLRQGQWDGTQVVPTEWVEASTRWYATGTGPLEGWGYGYQWWLIPDLPYKVFEARGRLGQHIMVVPERDLVVVFTSRTETGNVPIELLRDYILPSVKF